MDGEVAMDVLPGIEHGLDAMLERGAAAGAPPALVGAVRHAVFPGGARVRPRLCLAVAAACGAADSPLALGAALSLELLHCASLVHDDLPCFDDAPTRRGRPSVHAAFGERLAVLAGDALIVLAFESLASGAAVAPTRLPALLTVIGRGVGMPAGIVAGQAWECERECVLADYQRAKTGALFVAATAAGAVAAGADPAPWRSLGECLGDAYQVADDLRDACAEPEEIGKPVGRDAALGRPSVVTQRGVVGASAYLESLVRRAIEAIPPCAGADGLRELVMAEARRLRPPARVRRVA
jgi:geranylgeranyl diphosphate synthase type II